MVVISLAAAGGLAAAARATSGGSASAPRAEKSPAVRVVLPGRPGESARVTDSDQVTAPDGSTYNTIDTTFVQMMIVHHGQAIEMAALAPDRAADDQLRALAGRIGAAQAPEVAWLRGWLRDRGLPESDAAHDHADMPGMQSPADMTALTGLTGSSFDRRFATMMTAHHRGAVRMAQEVLAGGSDERLREVAGEMAVEQGSEINRIQQLGLAA
ncbi:uncharacterized protein (DUF305 family) [Actinoplanes tereljensis]|uniref:Lipoprotein n=1 Tax=Paractinoplanes tereljensis TaxID=571912 RepID=A0A919NQL2_9ACTN|nr:DUF305 domain-containing protein [Actinoplanes tereljensis]GIF22455.1 lipoprotein [Actinoplanes tereljensis]